MGGSTSVYASLILKSLEAEEARMLKMGGGSHSLASALGLFFHVVDIFLLHRVLLVSYCSLRY